MPIQEETIEQVNLATSKYKYGFSTDLEVDKAPKGLTEDTIKLISSKKFNVNCDSTLASLNLYEQAKHDYFSFLANSAHRKRLKFLNIEKDTEFCLNPDFKSKIIPTLKNGKLVAL